MTEGRIPQKAVDDARAMDVAAVAVRYGFRSPHGRGETVGPCPGCGGIDRFSVNGVKNIWRCRQGGGDPVGGDAIALVQHVERVSFPRAVEILTGDLSALVQKVDTQAAEVTVNQFREKERARAYAIWRAGRPFPDGGAVAAYLDARRLSPADARMPGAHCREHSDLAYWHYVEVGPGPAGGTAEKEWRIIHRGPAMLWPIVDGGGHFLGLHATWIDPAAPKGKAEVFDPATGEQLPAKKVRGSKKGGCIVLHAPSGRADAAVGEGIESALSWRRLRQFDGALYSAVDLGNLAGKAARTFAHPTAKITRRDGRQMPVRVPGPDPKPDEDQSKLFSPHPGIGALSLIGDADSDLIATRAAMQRAVTRLLDRHDPIVTDWPPLGHDFNSLLMERTRHAVDG